MEKSIFEQMGGTYYQQSDYLLPNLDIPEPISVGIWGRRHLRYIIEYRKALYIALQLSGELGNYLVGINQQAEDMFSQLVKQMKEKEGITEQLKKDNQIGWIQQMNNIQERVIEIINTELIYT